MSLQLPMLAPADGWTVGGLDEANVFLEGRHYLGPCPPTSVRLVWCGYTAGELAAVQVWRLPAARFLPNDGSWWELARWCLTPRAGTNAGSRMHRAAVGWIRENRPEVTTLVSYSDPSAGHSGALYKACNWQWKPTWLRLRPPPSGNGKWDGTTRQEVKDRWVFAVRRDPHRDEFLRIDDLAAVRFHERAVA